MSFEEWLNTEKTKFCNWKCNKDRNIYVEIDDRECPSCDRYIEFNDEDKVINLCEYCPVQDFIDEVRYLEPCTD